MKIFKKKEGKQESREVEDKEYWEARQNLYGFFNLLLEVDQRISPDLYNEVNLRWSRSQMFVFINAAAFSFLGLRPALAGIVIAMGVIGIILDLFWVYINQKSEEWVNYWQAKIRKIDQEATEQDVRMFSGAEWDVITRRYTFHEILNAFSGIFMLLWFAVIVYGFTLIR